jgi:homoaconitase/3-isopropylmalate dehydratase large subunit
MTTRFLREIFGEYFQQNFEGRQGPGSRTLLASPFMAAAAVTGVLTDQEI